MKLTYVAYSPLDLQSANSIQTFNTCRALAARLGGDLTVIVPSFGTRELDLHVDAAKTSDQSHPTADSARPRQPVLRVVKIPRVPLNKFSRFVRSAVWGYLERTVYAWLAALFIGSHRADLVYVRDVICAFWLVALRAPVVYEVHDLESRHPSRVKSARLAHRLAWIDERTLRGARGVVSLTHTFKDELVVSSWQSAGRVFVVPDAYDEAVYHPRSREEARAGLNLPGNALVIGYAGMTFAYRRLDLLLEALKIWNEPRAYALIIGGRPSEVEELKRHTQELDLGDAVLWRGRQPPEATARDLSAADILVIPDTVTDATASPLKMFEYMALGRAIVAVDRPALREVLSDNAAVFFRAGDAADFARALRVLGESEELRHALSAHALECVREYTYTQRAARILQSCETILDAAH